MVFVHSECSINGSYYIIKTKTKFNNKLWRNEGSILSWSHNVKLKLINTFFLGKDNAVLKQGQYGEL